MATVQQNIKNDYNLLLVKEAILKVNKDNNAYYALQEEFNKMLKGLIYNHDLSLLNSKQLLKLCGWVNTHRPMALHAFLYYAEKFAE